MFKKKALEFNSKLTKYGKEQIVKSENFDFLNTFAEKGQIVFIGDSIIELFPVGELFQLDRKIYNRGISGDTCDRLLERLQSNAIAAEPTTICILCGTNDMNYPFPFSVIWEFLGKAIDEIKCNLPQCKVVVQGIYPVHKSLSPAMVKSRKHKDIVAINKEIEYVCKQKNAIFVDMSDVLSDKNNEFDSRYTYDGLHPNAQGYSVIANKLRGLL